VLKDDGDIIRGLGYVTLYAAYLEEQIDELLVMLKPVQDGENKDWQISKKIKQARKLLNSINNEKFEDLILNLDRCAALFNHRNELTHGRIYGRNNRTDILKSGRPNVPDREVDSAELYQLATDFWMPAFDSKISKALNEYKPKTEN
jgi:hypothetical protein